MSEPFTSTGAAGSALAGASLYGILTGTDYGVVFGAFAGAVFYVVTAAELTAFRRIAYFVVSYIAGVLCAGLVGSKLSALTGYTDKPLDALGAVIVSALAIKILTWFNNQDMDGVLNALSRFRGGGGNGNSR
ncbi:phage holin family protein [Pectobacterium carotovorum]|uniref:phage holin family protein n=1 Tax=Pectobacterium carotovorum TaxID=554 RepID=UPI00380E3EFA